MYNKGTEETQRVFSRNMKHDPVQRLMEKHSIQITYHLGFLLVDILLLETLAHVHGDMYGNIHSSTIHSSRFENHVNVNEYKRR